MNYPAMNRRELRAYQERFLELMREGKTMAEAARQANIEARDDHPVNAPHAGDGERGEFNHNLIR